METKLWIPLLFTLLVLMPAVSADSIEPIEPIAGAVGSEVNMTCDATITNNDGIRINKITASGVEPSLVQLSQPDYNQQPKNPAKYQLTKTSLHGFYITIKNVEFGDAARYQCSLVFDDTVQQRTTVVVVREPTMQMVEKIQAGVETQITCDAEYQVPSDLSRTKDENRFPMLAASVGERWLTDGTTVDNEVDGSGRITTTWNTSLEAADDQKPVLCKVFTTVPPYEQTKTKTANVIFDVQNIVLAPEKQTYAVGEEINCTAQGNPAPKIGWTRNSTNMEGPNDVGSILRIQNTMMGEKKEIWKCEATASGKTIEAYIEFVVEAAPKPTPDANKESPTAAIAAGVSVGLVVIIALVVVLVVVIMKKRKKKTDKPPAGDTEGKISPGPFTNPVTPDDDQHNKPGNNPTAYQSQKPSVPPHQKPHPPNTDNQNFGYQPSKYDEDLNMDMSAEMARRALTPLPMEEADYDIPYNDGRGQPRLADVAAYAPPPPGGPPPGGPPPGGLPPDEQYSVVHRPPPTPTNYPDMAAAHPGLQQVYNMPKPRAVPRQPADTTV